MTSKRPFTADNTEGYTASELSTLNAMFERAGGFRLDPIDDGDEHKRLCERVLADFDAVQS